MIRLRNILFVVLGTALVSQVYGQMPQYVVLPDSGEHEPLVFKEVKISGETGKHSHQCKTANQSTEEHLEQISGLSLVRRGNYAAEPVFRGLNSGQMAVTIDGMKIFGACTDKMDPVTSYVAPDNLAKACMDQTGDCNASCNMASLDLRTKNLQLKPGIKGSVSSGFNSNGMGRQLGGEVSYGNQIHALRVQMFYTHSDVYRAGGQRAVAFTQFTKFNGSVHYKRKLKDGSLFQTKYIADRAYDIGYPALPMDVSFAGGDILSFDYKKQINTGIFEALQLKAYGNSIEHIMDDTKRPDVVMHMDMPGTSRTVGAFAVLSTVIGDHRLRFKPEFFNHRAYAEMTMYPTGEAPMFMLTWPDVRRNSSVMSVFHSVSKGVKWRFKNSGQLEWQSNRVASDWGIRQLEAIGYAYEKPLNRLAYQLKSQAEYRWSSKVKSSFKLAVTERTPSTSEAFGYYLYNSMDGYDYMGNPDLKNEKSLNAEYAISYHSDRFQFSAAVFHYQFADYIIGAVSTLDAMTLEANGVREYQNMAAASISGAETMFKTNLSPSLNFIQKNTYSYGLTDNKDPLPLIPPFKSTNQLRYNWKGFEFETMLLWALPQNRNAEFFGETQTPSYTLVDFNVLRTVKLSDKQLSLQLSLKNLMDVYYADHLDWNKIPRPGRSVNVNVRYSF